MATNKYRPDVDGLRAVAVLLVMLFHTGLGFPGGYVGVDVFFVISGFLITGLILKDQEASSFRLRDFWIRRIRRIAPASLTMAVCVLIAGGVLLLPKDYEQLAEATVAHQLMFANFHFWKNTGYFDGPSEMMPLLHTWSLAVEEQFYLVYPLLLWGIAKASSRLKLGALLVLFFASLIWSIVEVQRDPAAAFYLLPTRAWEMLLGSLLCFIPTPSKQPTYRLEMFGWLGIASIVIPSCMFDSLTPFPGAAALLPCLGAACLIYANSAALTTSGKLLATKPLVFVGLISYSLYLWHWPLLAFARYWIGEELSRWHAVTLLSTSFVLAWFSWRFIETPFRRKPTVIVPDKKARLWERRPIAVAVTLALVLAGMSQLVVEADGLRGRFSNEVLAILDSSKLPVEFYAHRNGPRRKSEDNFPSVGDRTSESIDFLVWGDSHAMAIGQMFERLGQQHHLQGKMAAAPGTLPLLGTWRAGAHAKREKTQLWNEQVLEFIHHERIRHVVLVGRWAAHVEGRPNGDLDTLLVDKDANAVTRLESRKVLLRGFERTLAAIEQAGARTWILGQVPLQGGDPVKRLIRAKLFRHTHETPRGIELAEHKKRQSNVLDAIAQTRANHAFIDPVDGCFDERGLSLLGDGTKSFYYDNDHLSSHGAETLLSPLLNPVMEEIAASRIAKRSESLNR